MNNIVVSLTTIKSRIRNLPKILSSIIDKNSLEYTIHVFYSETECVYDTGCDEQDLAILNDFIKNENKSNVKILVSKVDNFGPFRKIIPALRIYNDHIIITIDDDEIFESPIVDEFVNSYNKFKCIISSVGRIVDIGNCQLMNDTIDYYKKIFKSDDKCYMNILPEGYGGILYHTNMFNRDFIDLDYSQLDMDLLRNDDLFLRYYTYNRNIPVYLNYIYQSNIYNSEQIQTLFKSNKKEKLSSLFLKIVDYQKHIEKCGLEFDAKKDINDLISLHSMQKNDTFKKSVHTGTDVKKLQYRINYNGSDKFFNIHEAIQRRYFNGSTSKINTILINIEKDTDRYQAALDEFKKLLISDFVHLKATYWKEKEKFVEDMNTLFNFLKDYNSQISYSKLELNKFSEFNDPNIMIQDGPLACYCSHMRAMVYGYLHFNNYTLIVEDDFFINDMDLIIENIQNVPDDWDVIYLGAQPINKFYEASLYKFSELFHSSQFYIIRNSSMEHIFKGVYPIEDQIDILMAKLYNSLNIYNLANATLQKNFESNTQNNLYVIYNSPNYEFIRICIDKIKCLLSEIIVHELKLVESNSIYIQNIVLKILFDVIFSKITIDKQLDIDYYNKLRSTVIDRKDDQLYSDYFIDNYREKLFNEIYIVINSSVKGINTDVTVTNIINDIYHIIKGFNLVNTIDDFFSESLVPLNYGSTSNVYLLSQTKSIVVKVYNDNLRWKTKNHDNSQSILQKEIQILNKLTNRLGFQKLIKNFDNKLYLDYVGETLFDNFVLPINWIEQLNIIFNTLTLNNIYYPEFNLKNITNLNNQLYFIDYGLAEISENANNLENFKNFVEFISSIQTKFAEIDDLEQQHIYYNNYISNLRLEGNYISNIF